MVLRGDFRWILRKSWKIIFSRKKVRPRREKYISSARGKLKKQLFAPFSPPLIKPMEKLWFWGWKTGNYDFRWKFTKFMIFARKRGNLQNHEKTQLIPDEFSLFKRYQPLLSNPNTASPCLWAGWVDRAPRTIIVETSRPWNMKRPASKFRWLVWVLWCPHCF